MTRNSRRKIRRRVIASVLTGMFMLQATSAFAVSSITAGTVNGPNQIGAGISNVGNTYNLTPGKTINNNGYSHYSSFYLGDGDIANLNYNGISGAFYNLVDNQININGVLNTTKNGAFHNGKAVFVSPKGMVVGASGVLNVGSLSFFAPSDEKYKSGLNTPSEFAYPTGTSNAPVTINGKILAVDSIELNSGSINIGADAALVAGINSNKMGLTKTAAENLFDNIVNGSYKSATDFVNENGTITIKSTPYYYTQHLLNSDKGININGEVRNIAKNGTTTLQNNMADGIKIVGNVYNDNGTLTIANNHGNLDISGHVKNNGTTKINNIIFKTTAQKVTESVDQGTGNITYISEEYVLDDYNSKLNITGKIETEGDLTIQNTGYDGLNIANAGSIKNTGTTIIQNGFQKGSQGATERNPYIGSLNIDGTIENIGDLTINNYAEAGGLTVGAGANITSGGKTLTITNDETGETTYSYLNSQLNIYNNGAQGMNLGGNIEHRGDANVTNDAGKLTVGGTFTNNGSLGMQNIDGDIVNNKDATFINNGTDFDVTGTLTSNTGKLYMTNDGSGNFTVAQDAKIDADGIEMRNNKSGDFIVNGQIINNGNGLYENNGTGNYVVSSTSDIQNKLGQANFTQNGDGTMSFNGTITNQGTTNITNAGNSGLMTIGGSFANNGETHITNNGAGIELTSAITNTNGKLSVINNKGYFKTTDNSEIKAENVELFNNAGYMTLDGDMTNSGNTEIINKGDGITIGGNINSNGIYIDNNDELGNAQRGIAISGNITNKGNATISNTKGSININGGTINNTGTMAITNGTNASNIAVNSAAITNKDGKLTILNKSKNGGTYVYSDGKIENKNHDTEIVNNGSNGTFIEGKILNGGQLDITNTGYAGIEVIGTIDSTGKIVMNNTGHTGIYVGDNGLIKSANDVNITNTPTHDAGKYGKFAVYGKINGNNVNITTTKSDLTIGSQNNDNNITAVNNINITANDASILNHGYAKTLLNAGANLNMNVTNGTIGSPVKQAACTGTGCTGIGPMADGSRDFTKSINANVGGKVNAKTVNTAGTGQDLVINYAAINSDMNIDAIKADGRVILTVDDDFGANNTGTRYNMVNASTDPTKANVEGWGISLISNGSIGKKDNKLTFNQTKAPQYAMDALANENIYMKGLDDKYTVNEVCTMIAREGDLDVEFSGNTHIKNITAEGDMTVITRGKDLTIDNLGHIEDPSITPNDYFGPRHDGYEFDGRYDKADYKSDILPNNVTLKALDINKNVRPDGQMVDGYYAYADSKVRVNNGVIDNGTMDITADNIYANGIYAGFNRLGFTKIKDDSTNPIVGIVDPDALNSPVGHAVRPDDVTGIGRDEHERNYYYPTGDGDITSGGNNSNVDDNDDIVDDTPLKIGDKGEDTPDGPNIKPNEPNNNTTVKGDESFAWKKVDDNDVEAIDKRQYMRFNVDSNPCPVAMERTNNGIDELIDVSRGGIAVTHSNKLKVGDVVPVHLTYADLDIKADVKVVSASTTRAGAEFVNLDKATANKLLYLSLLLEEPALSLNK